MITIALPKGRIAEDTLKIFEEIFGDKFKFESRKLILEKGNFRFLLVRNQDVPTYVYHGASDLGIVGLDVLEEQGLDLVRLLDLKGGYCRVAIGMKNEDEFDLTKPDLKVATKMTNIAKNYFAKKAVPVEVIKLYGSIELAPLINLADMIVDIVETGTTMKENGLKVVETIMSSTTHLVANKNSFIEKKSEILDIYEKIETIINKRTPKESC
jgi:ATP phosphoribosyltransferase